LLKVFRSQGIGMRGVFSQIMTSEQLINFLPDILYDNCPFLKVREQKFLLQENNLHNHEKQHIRHLLPNLKSEKSP
jgi:hypothetical protein